jgi:hypothetical protein
MLPARGSQALTPTFYKNVLPVFQQHCQTCHRPGEPGPMPLMDYAGVKPWAQAIRQAVICKQMPPWYADPKVGRFANDRSLSAAQISTIVDWVDAGLPPGDPKDAPKPMDWVEGWTIGRPEIVFEMPSPFIVPSSSVVPYQYVIVPTHFLHDTWVRLAEVRAGDRAHAHHIVVSVREPGSEWLAGEPTGVPFALSSRDRGGIPGEFLAGYGRGRCPNF